MSKINNLQSTVEPWRGTVEVSKINGFQTTLEDPGGGPPAEIVQVENQPNGSQYHSVK
jgi:hypothetical protein